MRKYERKETTQFMEILVEYKCDICGRTDKECGGLFAVAIEVNYNEEFGSRDEYDYCEECLMVKADVLVAAGSTAELVTGNNGN